MKTAELTGELLDYWVARAEGVAADRLMLSRENGNPNAPLECMQKEESYGLGVLLTCDYSTSWALTGPLLEKLNISLNEPKEERANGSEWVAWFSVDTDDSLIDSYWGNGETPLIAICRAVVRAAFGDEVEDLP